MKKLLISSLAVAAVAGWTTWSVIADETGKQKKEAEAKTIKGEVVDMYCYLDHGAKGEKHKQCATDCINGGMPVGLLTDEHVVLVVGEGHKLLNTKLAPMAGETVKVTGKVVHQKGVQMIIVKNPDTDIVKE